MKKKKTKKKARSAIPKQTKPDFELNALEDELNIKKIPPERKRKSVPYRVNANTVVLIDASLSKAQQQERFEKFCIKTQLGNWREYAQRHKEL